MEWLATMWYAVYSIWYGSLTPAHAPAVTATQVWVWPWVWRCVGVFSFPFRLPFLLPFFFFSVGYSFQLNHAS